VARNNFGFEKRQRELSKERKKEEKRQRKLDRRDADQVSEAAPQELENTETEGDRAP
jgi:hypothetical protein